MDGKIVVFDSGVGGISTLNELIKTLPHEDFVYFADNANAPYGTKSTDAAAQCVGACMERIFQSSPKAVVIACNTVTSLFIGGLRKKYPQTVFVGLQPAVKPALKEKDKKIVVFVTLATARSAAFNTFISEFHDEDIIVFPLIEGAGLVESGCGADGFYSYLCEQLHGVHTDDFTGVVAGCTHFVLVKEAFEEFFPHARIYDGNKGAAAVTAKRLAECGLLSGHGRPGEVTFTLTKDSEAEREKFLKIFNARRGTPV